MCCSTLERSNEREDSYFRNEASHQDSVTVDHASMMISQDKQKYYVVFPS